MSFGRQKNKKCSGTSPPEPPPGPCHRSARGLTAPPRPPAAFYAKRVSCSYNLGAFDATDVDFSFSALTPDKGKFCASTL